jgi:hypothetical protein
MTTDSEVIAKIKKHISTNKGYLQRVHTRIKEHLEFAGGNQYNKADQDALGDGHSGMVFNFTGKYCEDTISLYRKKPYGITYTARKAASKEKSTQANALVKGWESTSDFKSATLLAVDRQVKAGRGAVVMCNEYASESDGWDQQISIKSVIRPDMVLWDSYSIEPTGKDQRACLLVEHISQSKALEMGVTEEQCEDTFSCLMDTQWQSPDGYVELLTFYELEKKNSKIYLDAEGNTLSKVSKKQEGTLKNRSVAKTVCNVYRVVGNNVIDKTSYPLSRIPVVFCSGKLIDSDSKQDWVGEVHAAKDPARLVNWTASMVAENIALAPKTTRYVDMESIAPFKHIWQKSNRQRVPYLPYRSKVGDQVFNAPVTDSPVADIQTPSAAQANFQAVLAGVLGSSESGVVQEGAANETAAAVLTRSRSVEVAKYVYADNAAKMVTAIGQLWLEFADFVLDTERELPIQENGTTDIVPVDYKAMGIIPSEIEVTVDAGPLAENERRESLQGMLALGSMLGPEAALVFGDDLAKAAEFPGSEGVAIKLAAYAKSKLGIGGDPNAQQDPEAVAALEAASQATDALEQQLAEANQYINIMQTERQVAEIEAKAKLITQQMSDDTKILIERLKIAANDAAQQRDIQAEFEKKRMDSQAELLKLYQAQPAVQVVGSSTPTLSSIDGTRVRGF